MDLEQIKQQMLNEIDSDISLDDEIEAISAEAAVRLEKYKRTSISFQGKNYLAEVAFFGQGNSPMLQISLINEFDLRFQNPNSKIIKSTVEANLQLSPKENIQDVLAETLRYICDKTTITEEFL
jgi:hypothetical protein